MDTVSLVIDCYSEYLFYVEQIQDLLNVKYQYVNKHDNLIHCIGYLLEIVYDILET